MKLDYFKILPWLYRPWNRVLFMVFILIPIPVVFLSISLYCRLPAIERATREIKSSFWLSEEVERAKASRTEEKIEIAMTHWEDVLRTFPDSYEDVSYWIMDLVRFVSLSGFKMSYKLGELKQARQEIEEISLLPIKVKLIVQRIDSNQSESVPAGIIQFVELLREIVTSYHGVDLAGAMVTGSGNGIKTMNVDLNLWVRFATKATSQ